jgi:hexosaminidase
MKTKDHWKAVLIAKRIHKEGLKDVKELQSYFIKRIEKFIISKKKKN